MEELLKVAKKFLEENPGINEVELTDSFRGKVKVVRNIPVVYGTYWYPGQWTYQPQYYVNP